MNDTQPKRHCPLTFFMGDVVEATRTIVRHDGCSILHPGDLARVLCVFRAAPHGPQIVALEIQGQLPIGDIVCFDDVPLKIIHHSSLRGGIRD